MLSKKLVYKRHFLGVPKVVLNALLWVPRGGLELQFLELINVFTEVIIILFLCESFKFYKPGMGICPPNTIFLPIGRDIKGL
jgi:hypothetical protein